VTEHGSVNVNKNEPLVTGGNGIQKTFPLVSTLNDTLGSDWATAPFPSLHT